MGDIALLLNCEIQDILRVSGIKAKGYGILPKYAMLDRDLTLEAKSIYAYLCSLTGNGDSVYPSRDTIMHDLLVGKDSYYKHFSFLKEHGYISVSQQRSSGSQFNHNVYTIEDNPKKFEAHIEGSDSTVYSKIRFSGLEAAGYGMIPRAVMIDPRLEIKAKGIYAYFCAFSGSGSNSFPKQKNLLHHLNIAQATYYKFYNMLIDLNYIQVIQRRNDGGRMSINDYYLIQNPNTENTLLKPGTIYNHKKNAISPIANIPDTENPDTENPDTENPDTENPDTENPDTENPDTIIINSTINSDLSLSVGNSYPSIHQKSPIMDPEIAVMDGLTETDYRKYVFKLLWDSKGIPFTFKTDDRALRVAIKILLNGETENPDPFLVTYNSRSIEQYVESLVTVKAAQEIKYFNEEQNDLYSLLIDALVDLCSFEGKKSINSITITSSKVIEKLNENIQFSNNLRYHHTTDRYMLLEIADDIINTYITASKETEIKVPFKYMQAVIWSRLIEKGVQTYAASRRV